MDDRIITVARYDQAVPAHIDRARLESVGIPATVANDNQPGLFVFHAVVGRSVELQIFEHDAEEALAILNENAGEEPTAGAAEPVSTAPACPACGSHSLRKERRLWPCLMGALTLGLVFISFAIAAAPLLLLFAIIYFHGRRRPMRCADCGRVSEAVERLFGAPGTRRQVGRGAVYW